jgi:hypothetical protein
VDLREFSRELRSVVRPSLVVSEHAPGFHSYHSAEGIKVDFVVDELSAIEERPLVALEPGIALRVDTLHNIVLNKLFTVVSRQSARDAIDVFCLFQGCLRELVELVPQAARREKLLEDTGYVAAAFENIGQPTRSRQIVDEMSQYQLVRIDPANLADFFSKSATALVCV